MKLTENPALNRKILKNNAEMREEADDRRKQETGYRYGSKIQDTGYWILDTGNRIREQNTGNRK